MNLEMLKKSDRVIYEVIAGSHAYNLHTPSSDSDIRGIFIVPSTEYLGLTTPPEQIGDEKHDITYYSLKRFFELAKDCNPNIIELLFFSKDSIKICTPVMQKLIDNRHLFISKKAYYKFSGYAYSQISKATGQEKMINHPELAIMPVKEDFCYFIDVSFDADFTSPKTLMPFRPVSIKERKWLDLSQYHVAALEHVSNTYRLYYYGKEGKGVFRGNDMLVCESIPIEDEKDKFAGLLIYNKHEFEKAVIEHRKYEEWIKMRNPERWKDQEGGRANFDGKNMMHCMRLLISGENILKSGEPIVRFDGELRDYLMKIRRSEFKYEEIMAEVEKRMAGLEELYKTSTIPHSVNMNKIEALYRELTKESV